VVARAKGRDQRWERERSIRHKERERESNRSILA
jgi:hypothetical protein